MRNNMQCVKEQTLSPLSVKHPRSISNPNSSSLAVSWQLHVVLLHDLIFVPHFVKALPLLYTVASAAAGLPDGANSCSFAEKVGLSHT